MANSRSRNTAPILDGTYRDDIRRAERNETRSKWVIAVSASVLVVMLFRL